MLISDLSSEQLLLLVLPILPNMWALNHCFHRDFPTEKEKARWMMASVFLPCVGGLAYFFVGRKRASKERIDVFQRYGKDAEGQGRDTAPAAPAAAAEPTVPMEEAPAASPAAAEGSLASGEGRARAPWDDPAPAEAPAEAAGDAPAPRAKGEWSFGCPDDVRKA